MSRFVRYRLRTTDLPAARDFYAALLGPECAFDMTGVPAEAIARGARPHWLGVVAVHHLAEKVAAFVDRGAMQLGPIRDDAQGGRIVILRDPGGAIVGLASGVASSEAPPVVWHGLNTRAVARAIEHYRDLFGWHFTAPVESPSVGTLHPFAFDARGEPVGSASDIAHRPGVHPHWLFHFAVPSLDHAMDTVRARGGLVLGPFTSPRGERIAVCDDPLGAAFALRESQ